MHLSDVKTKSCFSFLALACSAQFGMAQVSISSRSSTVSYNYVYGFGADTHSGSDTLTKTALVANDQILIPMQGSTSGTWAGTFDYAASVQGTMQNSYSVYGPATNQTRIRLTGTNVLSAAASGFGLATLSARNPGNEQTVFFTVGTGLSYRLLGNVAFTPGGDGYLALERWDGFTWQKLWYSWLLPGLQGPFNILGSTGAGSYKLIASSSASADTNPDPPRPSSTSSYSLTLRAGARVTGTVNLQSYVGTLPQVVTFTITKGSSVDVQEADVNPITGEYEYFTYLRGNASVQAKGRNWLSQTRVLNLDLNSGAFNLLNGDADGDNEVTILDYLLLSAYFDRDSSWPLWSTPDASGFSAKDADLDGDSTVSILDYIIMSTNYELAGS